MAYKICKIKNISGEEKTLMNKVFAPDEVYRISDAERIDWSSCDQVISAIVLGAFNVMDLDSLIEGISNQIDFLKDYYWGDLC